MDERQYEAGGSATQGRLWADPPMGTSEQGDAHCHTEDACSEDPYAC